MHIGIAFDLKPDSPLPAGAPDDLHEEFDSPVTIRAIVEALRGIGHTVSELGDGPPLLEALLKNPPDFVFNIAEGTGISRNREARVPAVCEMLGIPCTGSDPLTLAVALDKDMTRRIVADAGIVLPAGFVLAPQLPYDGDFHEFPALLAEHGLACPVILKPTCEGSSKGIRNRCLIETPEDFGPTVVELWNAYRQPVLVEEFIAGEEVTVGVVGNSPPEVLGAMRVVPKAKTDRFVYSLEVKRNWEEMVTYECPPKLVPGALRALEQAALAAYEAVGCRDVARLDFRVRDGVPYFIEVNPLPGLNPISSDLILISKAVGVSHAELIRRILTAAVGRQPR
jgi:D-alanine-D-alanine ligase